MTGLALVLAVLAVGAVGVLVDASQRRADRRGRRRPRHLAPPPPGLFASAFPPRTPRHRKEPTP